MIPAAILVIILAVVIFVLVGVWANDHLNMRKRMTEMETQFNRHITSCRGYVQTVIEEEFVARDRQARMGRRPAPDVPRE
jgi:hypothetical protein